MNILGICGGVRMGNWDAAAALIVDGNLRAAAEEERFTRVKHAPGNLPTYAIRYCLKEAGLRMEEIDLVVFPGITYRNMLPRIAEYFQLAYGCVPKIELCDHHEAHAAAAFFVSGYDDALVVTFDFSGDGISTTISKGSEGKLQSLQRWPFPNSIGLFYAMVTQQLGFDFGEDEYKVMGLASYGTPDADLSGLLESKVGDYQLNSKLFRQIETGEPPLSTQEPLFNGEFQKRFGPPRRKGGELGKSQENFAASAQMQLEKTVLRLLEPFQKKTQSKNLCLAGGVAMNCVLNQKLAESGFYDSVFVPPVAGDNGLALGAALIGWRQHDTSHAISKLQTAAWGPAYSKDQLQKALKEVGAPFEEIADPAACAAEMIERGLIIGWYQGRMEYGARALGHRSILADPRLANMKERVNAVVKFREGFRPFAPSVLLEDAGIFFEKSCESPFMARTFNVRHKVRKKIPAVTHVDGTARVQTVDSKVEPLYHQLLSEFKKRTGVPVVLNTSFNIRGQPIVENPNQAISTFYGSGLDALLLGPYLLRKAHR